MKSKLQSTVNVLTGFLLFFVPVLFTSHLMADNRESEYQELLDAVNADNLDAFEQLLRAGYDPNYIGELKHSEYNWVMCRVAGVNREKYLELALEHGGNPNALHPELANNPGGASASNPLVCAIGAGNLRAVKILYAAGGNLKLPVCQLCDAGRDNRELVELATIHNQYDIVYWMLTETEERSHAELERIVTMIEYTNLSKNVSKYPWFPKTIKHLESLGFDIEREG